MAINGSGVLRCSPVKWLKSKSVWKGSERRGNKLFIIPQLSQACFMHKYGQKLFLKSYIVMGKDKEARRSVGRLPCSTEGKRSFGGLMPGRGCFGEGILPGGTGGSQRQSTACASLIFTIMQPKEPALSPSPMPEFHL